jgi:hypothetical protein
LAADQLDELSGVTEGQCRANIALDMSGILDDNPELRTQAQECWAKLETFLEVGANLEGALRPYVEEDSVPPAIVDVTTTTANIFRGAALVPLTPECRTGAFPDFDVCTGQWRATQAVVMGWKSDLSPKWHLYL